MFLIKLFTYIFAVILLGCTATIQTESSAPRQEEGMAAESLITDAERNNYRNAITALNNNKLDLAENILKEMLGSRNNLAGPWANLGLVYLKKNDIEQALKSLDHSLQLNPKQPQALNLMGIIEYNKGNLKKAIEYYDAAILNKPDYANAHYNLALLYDIFYQDIPKAVMHYQRYMEIIDYQDEQTAIWLEQLINSLKNS